MILFLQGSSLKDLKKNLNYIIQCVWFISEKNINDSKFLFAIEKIYIRDLFNKYYINDK